MIQLVKCFVYKALEKSTLLSPPLQGGEGLVAPVRGDVTE